MKFPKSRFLFKVFQLVLLSIFYFCLLKYASYLFYPVTDFEAILIVALLAMLEIISVYIEFRKSNYLSRFSITVLDSVKWFAIMIAILSLAIFIVNWLFIKTPIFYNRLALILVLGLFIYGYYNAHNPQIVENTLYLDNLDEDINIIHLSDIHIGSVRTPDILKKIVSKIKDEEYDFIIISGDIADGSNEIQPHDFDEFKKIEKPIIFTPGNHDYYTGIENVYKACENAGITVLDNNQTKIKGLNIYGIGFANNNPNLKINSDENNLLIFHIPANWDEFIEEGFNIILSGHTHGGQFYPANLFVGLAFPLLRGLYENDGNYINVSDGVGTLGPPLRIGTKSEISLLKLRKRP